jgi:hypothetical protein
VGRSTLAISRSALGLANLLLNLQVDLYSGSDVMSGSVSSVDGSWTSAFEADRAIFSVANPAPTAGIYTFVLPRPDSLLPGPDGHGYGLVSVSSNGVVSLTGFLGDATAEAQTGGTISVSKDGNWPLYMSLYSGKGLALGWINVANIINTTNVAGSVTWIKPANSTNQFYPAGFTNDLDVVASTYIAPGLGVPILAAAVTSFVISGGDVSVPLTNAITLNASNQITVAPPNALQLNATVSTNNGAITGTFINPTTGATNSFKGAVVQSDNFAAGQFSSATNAGAILIY